MIYNIFYNSNREIGWTTDSECPDYIVQDQLTQGLKHLTVDQSDLPIAENYYVNEAEDGIVLKSTFNPTFSTDTPILEATINVTGLALGTEVFVDGVSKGTMSSTTLNLVATDPGSFTIKFKKFEYFEYEKKINVSRY